MRALAVLPTYDEAASLPGVIAAALAADPELEVLVVDDASPDGTGVHAERIAAEDPRVHVLHRPQKAGLGSAYLAGFAWGLARGAVALCELDADGSHDPADLRRLLDALTCADVAIGSRYIDGGGVRDWAMWRRALSRAGNGYVRRLTGMPIADATSGLRAYRRAVLEEIGLSTVRAEGYAFQIELALRAWRAGFCVVELPITFTERRAGASKISRAIVAEALWRALGWARRPGRREPAPHPRSVAASPATE